jgi:hypothetical protein
MRATNTSVSGWCLVCAVVLIVGCESGVNMYQPSAESTYYAPELVYSEEARAYGYIDTSGTWLIPPQFSRACHFGSGRALVFPQSGGTPGYIDTSGTMVFRDEHAYFSFKDSLVTIPGPDGWRVVDVHGQTVLPALPSEPRPDEGRALCGGAPDITFFDGLARASIRDASGEWRYGAIDTTGGWVIEPRFASIGIFSQGLAVASLDGEMYGYIDRTGRFAIPPHYYRAERFSEGMASVLVEKPPRGGDEGEGRKWVYIDRNGRRVIDFESEASGMFSEGLGPIRINRYWGFIDRSGRVVIEPRYKEVRLFGQGLAPVNVHPHLTTPEDRQKPGWGFVDRTGDLVIPATFYSAQSFINGLARVVASEYNEGEHMSYLAYINPRGEIVWNEEPRRRNPTPDLDLPNGWLNGNN